eukprot:c18314_g1_i1.p1 GENE.c18314_g1_i1~~c18314_g1_i1.p1  ORF type:complete len:252 (-),score=24.42 c18314_g1_i1:598-1353(-)
MRLLSCDLIDHTPGFAEAFPEMTGWVRTTPLRPPTQCHPLAPVTGTELTIRKVPIMIPFDPNQSRLQVLNHLQQQGVLILALEFYSDQTLLRKWTSLSSIQEDLCRMCAQMSAMTFDDVPTTREALDSLETCFRDQLAGCLQDTRQSEQFRDCLDHVLCGNPQFNECAASTITELLGLVALQQGGIAARHGQRPTLPGTLARLIAESHRCADIAIARCNEADAVFLTSATNVIHTLLALVAAAEEESWVSS